MGDIGGNSIVPRMICTMEQQPDALQVVCWPPEEVPRLQLLDVQVSQPFQQPLTTG